MNTELNEAAERYSEHKSSSSVFREAHINDFKAGAQWQAEQYSRIIEKAFVAGRSKQSFENFKQEMQLEQFKAQEQKQVPTDEAIGKLAEKEIKEDFALTLVLSFGWKDMFDYGQEKFIKGFKSALQYSVGDGWIDVKDRLPAFDEKVLVLGEQKGMNPQMGGAYVSIAKRQDLSKTSIAKDATRMQDENQFSQMRYVTHWQQLPKPPINK